MTTDVQTRRITFDDGIVRRFLFASVIWGIVGMLVGVIVAAQMVWHQLNFLPQLSFGRLRPLHTNAVIFAFVGNMMFAGVYYSSQRLLKARMANDTLSKIHFYGWQAIIVSAALTLPLGITQGKEYAELEWPIDIAIAGIWVVFAINFFWTMAKRAEKHIYVAIWFYISTIITVAMLHIVNSLSLPLGIFKSYSLFSGVQDALVQWWYGHNAVAFFLTTPILGIMYYFMPKAADRPVYSYRLSIVHFWALVFLYIWAGPHHLLYTALPNWAQTLGMIFSVMLWAPSWGGMINGLLTLRGGWNKLRDDPVIKFLAAGVTFYGMSTFEGPLLSIKSVNGVAHYTDWIIGHVHSGALGWNGLMAAGVFYWLVPRLFKTKLHSESLANAHFWMATFGILFYMASMWAAGITQGMMLRAIDDKGALVHPDFVETLTAIRWLYMARLGGGLLFLVGMCLMAYNLTKTALSGEAVDGEIEVTEEAPAHGGKDATWTEIVFARPMLLLTVGLFAGIGMGFVGSSIAIGLGAVSIVLLIAAWVTINKGKAEPGKESAHRSLEAKALLFTVLTVISVVVGGVIEIIPTVLIQDPNATAEKHPPYKPLELEGRDIYVREGCYVCHSQMIRPMRPEVIRYGEPSTIADSAWDHPFQWGSKRTGPDLARVGTKYPNAWHYKHLMDPRSVSEQSIMPPYAFLAGGKIDYSKTGAKIATMKSLRVPYTEADIQGAVDNAKAQGGAIAADLKTQGIDVAPDSEMVALIAYLQRLGKPGTGAANKPVAQTGAAAPAGE